MLAFPALDKAFVVETDASIKGQLQDDGLCHPVAYASRSLTAAERNYEITELETLAVVWALAHYHSYLYGQEVTVYTDHSAVKAVLLTPNPSGKHARWWTKVYGSGIRDLKIVHRSGKSNANADSLSRSPVSQAPQEGIGEAECQVAAISSRAVNVRDISSLLQSELSSPKQTISFLEERPVATEAFPIP